LLIHIIHIFGRYEVVRPITRQWSERECISLESGGILSTLVY